MISIPPDLEAFTQFDGVVSHTGAIATKAGELIAPHSTDIARAKALFEWVRDRIPHTKDIDGQIVTCTAAEVLAVGDW